MTFVMVFVTAILTGCATTGSNGFKQGCSGPWLVVEVHTNDQSCGVTLVSLCVPSSPDTNIVRYALATDKAVTKGTLVMLVEMEHPFSSRQLASPNRSEPPCGAIAMPIKK